MYVSKNELFKKGASKTFVTQCFFTDHMNHETVSKTTSANRTPSANPRQLCGH